MLKKVYIIHHETYLYGLLSQQGAPLGRVGGGVCRVDRQSDVYETIYTTTDQTPLLHCLLHPPAMVEPLTSVGFKGNHCALLIREHAVIHHLEVVSFLEELPDSSFRDVMR